MKLLTECPKPSYNKEVNKGDTNVHHSHPRQCPRTPGVNQKREITPETLLEDYLEMTYEEQDNFIFTLLKGSLKFHKFLLEKSRNGDKNLPNTDRLLVDCVKLSQICELYQQIQ